MSPIVFDESLGITQFVFLLSAKAFRSKEFLIMRNTFNQVSSQVTFIYIALFTTQIVSKHLYSDNMEIKHKTSLFLEENCIIVHLK